MNSGVKKIKTAFIEDDSIMSEYLREILSQNQETSIAGDYSNAEDAIVDIKDIKTDIFLVDMSLPGMNGIEFIIQAKRLRPEIKFIVLTIEKRDSKFRKALIAGGDGYILKSDSEKEIIHAIKIVHKGDAFIHPTMAKIHADSYKSLLALNSILTKSEKEILRKLSLNMTYDEIAESRHTSKSTVCSHVKKIYSKLNVHNRDDAVEKAFALGVFDC